MRKFDIIELLYTVESRGYVRWYVYVALLSFGMIDSSNDEGVFYGRGTFRRLFDKIIGVDGDINIGTFIGLSIGYIILAGM